jgi:glutathione S-transferase
MWLMYTNSVIEPAMSEKFAKLASNPSAYGWGSWDQMLQVLRDGLARGPWILGNRFTAADVLLGYSCMFLRNFKMIGEEPVLDAYMARCQERPALRKAMAIEAAG